MEKDKRGAQCGGRMRVRGGGVLLCLFSSFQTWQSSWSLQPVVEHFTHFVLHFLWETHFLVFFRMLLSSCACCFDRLEYFRVGVEISFSFLRFWVMVWVFVVLLTGRHWTRGAAVFLVNLSWGQQVLLPLSEPSSLAAFSPRRHSFSPLMHPPHMWSRGVGANKKRKLLYYR